VNAFVSGGFLKQIAGSKRVGVKLEGFIHICDYYTTLAALAGVDHVDHRAALAKLPPVDGLNMAPWILGQVEVSPRTEVPTPGNKYAIRRSIIKGKLRY